MKIGIDISQIVYGTGVSVYTKNLVKNLLLIDQKNDYVFFAGSLRQISNVKYQISRWEGNFGTKIWPIPPTLADIIWNRLHILPIETFIGKVDVFHSSDWTQPPTKAFKVTTIHDLVPFKFPQESHPRIIKAHQARLAWVRDEVDAVIAVSESTKKDLIELGIRGEKIRVIPEAPMAIFKPQDKKTVEAAKKKYNLRGDYIFSIGVGLRKNTKRLIEAFQKSTAGKDLKLVLAGRPSGRGERVRGVIYLGHVSEEDLIALYSGAKVMVYPSLYEGFGLPVLEAMACGTPVVTSYTSSLPEVAGGAAVLVDPEDVSSIVEGIQTALRRQVSLRRQGLARAKQFSWQKTAEETLGVYKQATD